ncbi:MAG: hypothetical protein O2960_03890 [Verrucomicrobia bacterium]|nr:hypothetical protein [Verrucomicrobiota bacterium]
MNEFCVNRSFAPSRRGWVPLGGMLLGIVFQAEQTTGQTLPEYEYPPIEYSSSATSNRVDFIQEELNSERLSLPRGSNKTFLEALLKCMSVPLDSQVLVFSRTSLQRDLIRPDHPRAMYFSEDCYIGWVPGGLAEVAVSDPNLGIVFYHLDFRETVGELTFKRDRNCLSCHGGSMTRDWPGLIVRSIYPDSSGNPITSAGGFVTGHESRLEDRWGGWYVTGKHGTARHMGNQIASGQGNDVRIDRDAGANIRELRSFFATEDYLRPESDIVALMVLEHQVGIHNRLSTASLRVRKWTHYQRQLQKELGEPVISEPTGSALRVIQSEAQRILEYLFFSEEIPLPSGGIQGNESFQTAFRSNRHEDSQGRSLKDLDLSARLFSYRCSYMVYSKAFCSMPKELKTELYRRIWEVLDSENPPAEFSHLRDEERASIREILLATHSELAAASGRLASALNAESSSE